MRGAVRVAEIAGFREWEEGCFCRALNVTVVMLSYRRHSTGHTLIRVCCAATATHQTHRPGHKRNESDAEMHTHMHNQGHSHSQLQDTHHKYCELTKVLSFSGLHKSHKARPYSDLLVLKTIKKEEEQSEDLPLFYL